MVLVIIYYYIVYIIVRVSMIEQAETSQNLSNYRREPVFNPLAQYALFMSTFSKSIFF